MRTALNLSIGFLLLTYGCVGLNTNPPATSLPPGVTPDILKLHNSLVKMQEQALVMTMPRPSFGLSWHDANPPSAGVTEYRIYRGIGTNLAQATQLVGVVLPPDTVFIDSTVAVSIRYVYRVSSVIMRPILEKPILDLVSSDNRFPS